MRSVRAVVLAVLVASGFGPVACGPDKLPAFADPPDPDAGPMQDAGDDEDAGGDEGESG